MLSLDQLRVFDAIHEHGSFTAAAKQLRRATSALSYSVKTLEESLGLMLFDRSQHRATLTAEGQLLVAEARKVLERSAEFERAASRLREGWEPRLVFVVDGLVPLGPIMRAVRSFKELGAVTRLEVHVESVRKVRQRFYELDANFMLSLDGVDDASERALPTPPMELLLVAEASHPLVEEQRRMTRGISARALSPSPTSALSVKRCLAAWALGGFLATSFKTRSVRVVSPSSPSKKGSG